MYFVIKPMYNVQTYVFVNKYVNFNVPLNFNHINFNVFFSCFCLKLQFLFDYLTFLTFKHEFTVYIYILVLYSVFGKHNSGKSTTDQIEKIAFTAEFLTLAKTLILQQHKRVDWWKPYNFGVIFTDTENIFIIH